MDSIYGYRIGKLIGAFDIVFQQKQKISNEFFY